MDSTQYWFNITTKQVEVGHQSDWRQLMGPYASYAEAANALSQATARTAAWEEDDRDWAKGDSSTES